MSTSPLSPKLIKGAFVEFSDRFIGPVPNVIVFQYNPETMTRKLEPWDAGGGGGKEKGASEAATAQPFDPEESFDLKLELDAADALGDPGWNPEYPITAISGVTSRIAALEMLLYPQEDSTSKGLLGSVIASLGGAGMAAGAGAARGGAFSMAVGTAVLGASGQFIEGGMTSMRVPRGTVPTVLFVWGPGRIVPIRITSFSVEEQAYSPTLYPLRATISLGMKILAPKNIPCSKKEIDKKAIIAYNLYQQQKRGFAASNIANSVESIIKMLY